MVTLDWNRPYGKICGKGRGGAKWEQDGVRFRSDGTPVEPTEEPVKEPTEEAVEEPIEEPAEEVAEEPVEEGIATQWGDLPDGFLDRGVRDIIGELKGLSSESLREARRIEGVGKRRSSLLEQIKAELFRRADEDY